MSLVCESDIYKAYCGLCFYTGKKPLSKNNWKKQFHNSTIKQSRSVEDILKELDDIKEHV